MDEKRAAALGYPLPNANKDDRHLYGDNAAITPSASASATSIAADGLETAQASSVSGGQWQQNSTEDAEGQYDFVPHFQRVTIGGEHNSGVIIILSSITRIPI